MSITCDFRPNGVILWHEGVITDQMLLDINDELYAHRYEQGMQFQLIELSAVEQFDVSAEIMRQLAETDKAINQNVVACAVAPDDLAYGMASIWTSMSESPGFDVTVVRTREEARAWLASKGIDLVIES